MPLFRPAPAPPADPASDLASASPLSADALLSPEEIAERQRRRRWLVATPVLLLIAVGLGFGARPALHAAKAWQARRTAAEAERLIEQRKWLEARGKVQDAIQLWQHEPAAMRAAAHLLGRSGSSREAAVFWTKYAAARTLDRDEEREYTQVLLSNRDLLLAEMHLRKAWPGGEEGTARDWELGMQLALGRNRGVEAIELAQRLLKNQAATERQRLTSALVLASSNRKDLQTEGWRTILTLSDGKESPESLEALLIMAQRAGASSANPTMAIPVPMPPLAELISRVEAHPLAKIQHRLLMIDLRISQEPARRATEIQTAIDRFAGTKDDADLGIFVGWVYGKEEYARVLDILPSSRANGDPGLFFHRLDALAALDRWSDIRKDIQSHQVSIDPMLEQMYLARCATQLNEPRVRDARWNAALDAAGAKPEKLLQLGVYAQKIGNYDVAVKAFGAAVSAAPDARENYEALLGALEATGDIRRVRETLVQALQRWPQDTAVRNDSAYFDALFNENIRAALDAARQLTRNDPTSLPHRVTLALAELRSGHNFAAADAFKDIDTSHTVLLPRQRAVLAATFWATSYNREARETLRDLPMEKLLSEERALIQPIIDAGTFDGSASVR